MARDCVFCKIALGEIPSTKIHETDGVVAFLDIMPASPGHALVIPKEHYADLADVPAETLAALMAVVQKLGVATMKTTGADGYNVLQSNGKAAGQVIPHVHFHIIPRTEGDGLGVGTWKQGSAEQQELETYAERLRQNL